MMYFQLVALHFDGLEHVVEYVPELAQPILVVVPVFLLVHWH